MFVDFQELKAKVPIEDAVKLLGLEMELVYEGKQYRGACPVCEEGGGRSLVITPTKGYFCFKAKKGGDVISLTGHVKKLSIKDAATHLADCFAKSNPEPTRKESDPSTGSKNDFDPVKYRASLAVEHELLTAQGITKEMCVLFGMGVSSKGTHKDRIAFPLFDENGKFLKYASATDIRFPKERK